MKKRLILNFILLIAFLFSMNSYANFPSTYHSAMKSSIIPFSLQLYTKNNTQPIYKNIFLSSFYQKQPDKKQDNFNYQKHQLHSMIYQCIKNSNSQKMIFSDHLLKGYQCTKKNYTSNNSKYKNKNTKNRHSQKGTIYKITDKQGHVSYSNIYSNNHPKSTYKPILTYIKTCYACSSQQHINWHTTPLFPDKYLSIINLASKKYHIEPALIQAVIHAESHYNPYAVSNKNAKGLMQIMPLTGKQLQLTLFYNPKENIQAGSYYLSQLAQQFHHNMTKIIAAYNAGPQAVIRYNGIPPYKETKNYVKRVKILYHRYENLKKINSQL